MPVPRKFSSPFCGNGYRYGIKDCESRTVFNGMKCIQSFIKIYRFVETILGINQYKRTLNKDGGLTVSHQKTGEGIIRLYTMWPCYTAV
jgi:hypothetical protein